MYKIGCTRGHDHHMINWLSGSRFGSLHVGDLPLRQPRGHWGPCLRVSGEVVGRWRYRFIQFSCQFSWESPNLYGILKDLYPFERNLYGDFAFKDFRLQPCLEVDEVHQRKGDTLLHLFGGSAGGRWLRLNGEWGNLAFAKPARFSWLNSAEKGKMNHS